MPSDEELHDSGIIILVMVGGGNAYVLDRRAAFTATSFQTSSGTNSYPFENISIFSSIVNNTRLVLIHVHEVMGPTNAERMNFTRWDNAMFVLSSDQMVSNDLVVGVLSSHDLGTAG